MMTRRFTNVMLILIFAALVAVWARLPNGGVAGQAGVLSVGTALAAEEAAHRPVFGDYVGFAVDNAGFYILDPGKNQIYHYDQRGRVLQVYDIRELGQDFKVSYGHSEGG